MLNSSSVCLSNICHTLLKLLLFEVPCLMTAILLYTYILLIFALGLANPKVSLENYYTLLSNILLCFLNLLNCKIPYHNRIFLDLFYDFFLLFRSALAYVAILLYILSLILLISFQTLSSYLS